MIVKVEQAGTHSIIQDLGRPGYQAKGVPDGGVLDRRAARIANLLVGNPESHPLLEFTLTGPVLRFSEKCQISLTGGYMSPVLNGIDVPMYQTLSIPAKSKLQFGSLVKGCRTYLGIRGNWKIGNWLGSVGPVMHHKVDVIKDSYLRKGQRISISLEKEIPKMNSSLRLEQTIFDLVFLYVTRGPEFELLGEESHRVFRDNYFTVSKDWNQMGYRLNETLKRANPITEMLSSGVLPGTVQMNNSGQLMILLKGSQTSGGYPRIIQIIQSDLSKIAQMKTGDQLGFKLIGHKEAGLINEQRIEEWSAKRESIIKSKTYI